MSDLEDSNLRIAIFVTTASQFPLAREMASRLGKAGIPVALITDEHFLFVTENTKLTDEFNLENMATSFAIPNIGHSWRAWRVLLRLPSRFFWARQQREQFRIFVSAFFLKRLGISTVLKRFGATHAICFEDGTSGPSVHIAAAESLRVPVVVCPYEMSDDADIENLLSEKYERGELHEVLAKGAGVDLMRRAPQWIRRYNEKSVALFPPSYILAREVTLGKLHYPWIVNGGRARKIAVESDQMLDLYKSQGIPEKKLELLGTVYCDAMAEALDRSADLRSAYIYSRKIEAKKTRVLVSMPPSYHETRAKHSEFETYEELWFQLKKLCDLHEKISLTVSIHPNTQLKYRRFIESLGVGIDNGWILRALPACDVYLTCYSSTIRWALALGKPVVNYDAYNFMLPAYDKATGFFNFSTLVGAVEKITQLNDSDVYAKIASAMATERKLWGEVDGRAAERLIAMLRRTTKSRNRKGI